MAHLETRGYTATIRAHELFTDDVTDVLEELKASFDDDNVDEETMHQFLYRNATERQDIIQYVDIAERLAELEEDPENVKDIIKCLGTFPHYEKKFLINVLSSTASDEIKFMCLAETVFSKTEGVFTDFREACSSLNDDIVNCLRESPINNSGNMTDAVKSVLGGSSNPFLQDSQMYELDDKHRNMNMKHIFEQCRSGTVERRIFLKKLLIEADRSSNLHMVMKIVLSHCNFDLHSVLAELTVEDEQDISDKITLTEEISEECLRRKIDTLHCLENIRNENLKYLVRTAAFGVEE